MCFLAAMGEVVVAPVVTRLGHEADSFCPVLTVAFLGCKEAYVPNGGREANAKVAVQPPRILWETLCNIT